MCIRDSDGITQLRSCRSGASEIRGRRRRRRSGALVDISDAGWAMARATAAEAFVIGLARKSHHGHRY
eukprot:4710800-Pyramimonas_sp.AAC.1